MNAIPGISEPHSTQILALFKNLPLGTKVILFGSRAKGNFREGSDIDIALQGSQIDLNSRGEILKNYEDLNLPWKLDIAIYSLIEDPEIKGHIDLVGKVFKI